MGEGGGDEGGLAGEGEEALVHFFGGKKGEGVREERIGGRKEI